VCSGMATFSSVRAALSSSERARRPPRNRFYESLPRSAWRSGHEN
jgi:hypothetical protein